MDKVKKITKEEKKLLIKIRIERVDTNKKHAIELFDLHFKDPVKSNLTAWKKKTFEEKEDIMRKIIKTEDMAMIKQCAGIYKLNIKKSVNALKKLKHTQMVELGIR